MCAHSIVHSSNSAEQFNQNSIDRIRNLSSQNVAINLFIGRSPSANEIPLPPSNEKEVWVSLSVDPVDESVSLDPNRIHFILDCNLSDQMQKIQGLFRIVVIDLSTTKFFDSGTLERIVETVESGGSLIFPSEFKTIKFYSNNNQELPLFETEHFSLTVPWTKATAHQAKIKACWTEYFEKLAGERIEDSSIDANLELVINSDGYKNWLAVTPYAKKLRQRDSVATYLHSYAKTVCDIQPPSFEDEKTAAREQTKNTLLEQFNHVEICYKSYPYPNRYDNNGEIPSFYYYASGKKC